MARIVGIHGAFHQLWGPHEVAGRWVPAIMDGLWHAGVTIEPSDVSMAFYGDLFRADPADGRPTDEELMDIAREAGLTEVIESLAGSDGLAAISKAVGENTLRQTINQLGRYFADDDLRSAVQARLASVIDDDTRVVIAHSMGTVVAYEALSEYSDWPVETLLTIGSPLGGDYVFGHLRPTPVAERGSWPGSLEAWVNVASVGDLACAEPRLAKCFDGPVEDLEVDNGHRAHDAEPYLNAAATGAALAAALS
ncbi:MAG: GPI inositol-deacylase [Ilumatobacteraceae bacterium]|nr:GPI inositol-deacylase [Ilumatobacteraceae bacterium]